MATGKILPSKQRGFTLLEIMLVILLLALSATLVVGSRPSGRDRLSAEAQITRQLRWLEEDALISRQIYGVAVYRDGLRFMMLRRDAKRGLAVPEWPGYFWVPWQEKRSALVMPTGVSLKLEIEGRDLPLTMLASDSGRLPQWLIVPDGPARDRRLTVSGP